MYNKKVFDNKARLITVPSKDTRAVTLLFLFGVGSRYEKKNINGASHFIEHLMFKGTKNRPTTLDISKALDSVGAEFNAMTSKDYTGYYIKIDSKKIELAVDILSDMLLNSKFDNAEINRERGVILEEINMYHDNPMMHIETTFEESVYSGSSLGWDVAGPGSVIKKITRKQLVDYKNDYYRADNVVIIAAGKVDQKVEKLIKEKFVNKLENKKDESLIYSSFKIKQKKPTVKIQYKDTKQVQLMLGYPSFGNQDDRKYALNLLSIILGGNMSSRLFVSVRERKGLCYFVRCYPNYYQDIGNIVVQSGLDKTRIDQAIQVILQEIKKVKTHGVTAKELKNAKEFLRGKTILSLENSSSLAEYYAKQELLVGKILTPEQRTTQFDKVTLSDIKEVANDIFKDELINLALIGPFKSKDRFEKLFK
ncbi:insulinase family protein [Candidatus Falkowbacteria bacterium]|jgi:predicted Zn-dependent peptidase|nr:insulinase family protein [Candidatus Falkowbacteria bacterium]MBT7007449.1 insulinase family protein [Candidatus Falkowbacteria bacterium]